jgi:CspA family cold shock protein
MKHFKLLAIFSFPILLSSCGEKTDVVESGTYQGVVHEVEADKSEIYVKTADDKVLELYFTESTTLTRNGETVPFSELAEGKNVEVEVEKVGQRLDPISVKILE